MLGNAHARISVGLSKGGEQHISVDLSLFALLLKTNFTNNHSMIVLKTEDKNNLLTAQIVIQSTKSPPLSTQRKGWSTYQKEESALSVYLYNISL